MSSELKAFAAGLLFAAAGLQAQAPPQSTQTTEPPPRALTVYFPEEEKAAVPAEPQRPAPGNDLAIAGTVALGFLLGGLVWLGLRPALCPRCSSKLSKLERSQEDAEQLGAGGPAPPVLACQQCGEVARRIFGAWVRPDRRCRKCGRPTKKAALAVLEKSGYLTWGVARLEEDCLSCNFRSAEHYPTPPLEAPPGRRLRR